MLSFASDTKNGPWLLWIRKMPLLSSAKTLSDLKYVAALHVKPCEIFGIFWLTLANFPVFLYLPVCMMAQCDYSACAFIWLTLQEPVISWYICPTSNVSFLLLIWWCGMDSSLKTYLYVGLVVCLKCLFFRVLIFAVYYRPGWRAI